MAKKKLKIPKLFSFFSGIGCLDLGFENEGFGITFVNELHIPFLDAYKYARKQLNTEEPAYGYHRGNLEDLLEGKAKRHLGESIKDAQHDGYLVGFIGGPPCPDFSIGGKNRGHVGDHGRLSQIYIEIICQQKPDFFLFENVKGLWQTKRHRVFYEVLKQRLLEYGYTLTDRLINTIEYGTPQDRDRIILLGFKKELLYKLKIKNDNKPMVLPEGVFPWKKYAIYPDRKAFGFPWPTTEPFEEDSVKPCPHGIPKELTVEYWFRKNDVINHNNSEHCFRPKMGLIRFKSIDEGDDSRKSFKRLHRWRYSPTACYGNNEVHIHPYKARRITASEALAIQSMPASFILPPNMTLTNMFKAIGNGVPYIASRLLAKSILHFLRFSNACDSV